MHELSLAQNIIDIIREHLPNKKKKLKEVHVQIGSLMSVIPESLQFCYDTLVQNTPFEKSEMIITILPIKVDCQDCHTKAELTEPVFICPACGSKNLTTVQGNELFISHLEVR